jgi:hypothetical protein
MELIYRSLSAHPGLPHVKRWAEPRTPGLEVGRETVKAVGGGMVGGGQM